MAFDSLSSRLQMALRRVTGRGALNEKDIDDAGSDCAAIRVDDQRGDTKHVVGR